MGNASQQFKIANWTFGISRTIIAVGLIIIGIVIYAFNVPTGVSDSGMHNFASSQQWMGNNVLLPGFAILLAAICNFALLRTKGSQAAMKQLQLCQVGGDVLILVMTISCSMLTSETFAYLKGHCHSCNVDTFGQVAFGRSADNCIYGTNTCMSAVADHMGASIIDAQADQMRQTCMGMSECRDVNYDCSFLQGYKCKENPPICLVGIQPNVFILNEADRHTVCSLYSAKLAAVVFFSFGLAVNTGIVLYMLYTGCCAPKKMEGVEPLDSTIEGRPIGAAGVYDDDDGKVQVWTASNANNVASGVPVIDVTGGKDVKGYNAKI